MKTQNQTPEKRNSQEVEKDQTKLSRNKHIAGEKNEQDSNKLGSKKTIQPDEKIKSKGTTKH